MADPTNDAPKDENQSESNDEATNDTLENHIVEASKDASPSEEVFNHSSQTDTSMEKPALEADDEDHLHQQTEGIFVLWWNWAYFEIYLYGDNPSAHVNARENFGYARNGICLPYL